MRYLLALLLTTLATHAAAINGELFVAAGTTGTNAIPTSRTTNVTINATSKVTDAAGVTAFTFRTSNTLSDADLLAITNNTARLSYLDATGRWFSRSFYAEDSDGSENFVRLQPGNVRIHASDPDEYFDIDADLFTITGVDASGATTLLISPNAADGSNAYTFGSSQTHTSGFLATMQNNGTNVLIISPQGGIGVGPAFFDWHGFNNFNDIGTIIDGATSAETSATIFTEFFNQGSGIDNSVNLTTSATTAAINLFGSSLLTKLEPTASATTVPYIFNTKASHSSTNLFEVNNNSTNKLAVGAVQSAGQTALYLWDADNGKLEQVTVGAADSGGSGFKVLRIPN